MSDSYLPTTRTRVTREPNRGVYDRTAIKQILDEGLICHVAFIQDDQPFVVPTSYGRRDEHLYIHGATASRMLRRLNQRVPICVTVTLLDGLVLARSIFNHSMNYRSVVVLGTAEAVEDPSEKLEALRAIAEHVLPGRWNDARQPSDQELKATRVMRLLIDECSAKVREGPPIDDEPDHGLPIWAGIVPLAIMAGVPIDDPTLGPGLSVPSYAAQYSRGSSVRS
jgi:nitroimidazol reductase NimA-like FMN-containing flavoprotein (pyridoxamine 5'-phosphate oxidase superfamily)